MTNHLTEANLLIDGFIELVGRNHSERISDFTDGRVVPMELLGDKALSAYKMMGLHTIIGAHVNYRPTTALARFACGVARVELMKRRRGFGGQPVTAQCMLKHYTEGGDRGLEFDMCKSLTSSTAAQWEDAEYQHLGLSATWNR